MSVLHLGVEYVRQACSGSAYVWYRRAFQAHSLHRRTQTVKPGGERPIGTPQSSCRCGIQTYTQGVAAHIARRKELTHQRIAAALITALRPSGINDKVEPAFLDRGLSTV